MDQRVEADEALRRAYEQGFAAAVRGEEAAPGCTANAQGRAFLDGYIAGRDSLQRDGASG